QRSAYLQLCERMGVTDSPDNLSDDDLAALVQSFEVQSEHLSAVRYVGVLTIRFNPAALRRRQLALDAAAAPVPGGESAPSIPYAVPVAAAQHLTVAVRANTLAAWTQTKKRLAAIPLVAKLDTLDVARGIIHVDLTYRGTVEELRQAALTQGLMLRQDMSGAMEIYDGASVLR
ncbi:MAG: hypothetical protein PHE27_05055, partial [Alphaproteobacteria bacterium]|nr:hypothetical protein [Alphaproteobacteria bacterium]